MTTADDHNAVLGRVARAKLEPLGLIRKGRSRTWFDDRTWFVTIVEFQPSGFAKGSYLNVGACWMWWPAKPSLSFDVGNRVAEFRPAAEGDWEAACAQIADRAAAICLEIRREFSDLRATSERLNSRWSKHDGRDWATADAGVAAGLAGDARLARRRLAAVSEADAPTDSERERRMTALRLLDELDDLDGFREGRIGDIQRFRALARLPRREDAEIREALTTARSSLGIWHSLSRRGER